MVSTRTPVNLAATAEAVHQTRASILNAETSAVDSSDVKAVTKAKSSRRKAGPSSAAIVPSRKKSTEGTYTPQQREALGAFFMLTNGHPTRAQKDDIAEKLGKSRKSIDGWVTNQRQKFNLAAKQQPSVPDATVAPMGTNASSDNPAQEEPRPEHPEPIGEPVTPIQPTTTKARKPRGRLVNAPSKRKSVSGLTRARNQTVAVTYSLPIPSISRQSNVVPTRRSTRGCSSGDSDCSARNPDPTPPLDPSCRMMPPSSGPIRTHGSGSKPRERAKPYERKPTVQEAQAGNEETAKEVSIGRSTRQRAARIAKEKARSEVPASRVEGPSKRVPRQRDRGAKIALDPAPRRFAGTIFSSTRLTAIPSTYTRPTTPPSTLIQIPPQTDSLPQLSGDTGLPPSQVTIEYAYYIRPDRHPSAYTMPARNDGRANATSYNRNLALTRYILVPPAQYRASNVRTQLPTDSGDTTDEENV